MLTTTVFVFLKILSCSYLCAFNLSFFVLHLFEPFRLQRKRGHEERKEEFLPSRLVKEKKPTKEPQIKTSKPKVLNTDVYV